MRRRFWLSALCVSAALACGRPAVSEPSAVTSHQITHFRPGSDQTTFGKLEFVGGLVMSSSNPLFGAWSSVRFLPDGRHFIGVLDTGDWISGEIKRDDQGRLSGIDSVSLAPMINAQGRNNSAKIRMDAESLAIRDGKIYVGFEQRHRIDQYPLKDFSLSKPERSLPLPFPKNVLRGNKSLETVIAAPEHGPLAGGLVTITEESLDQDGNLYAGIVDGPMRGAFKVVRRDDFDVTDGAFLPDGDLVLLERRFTLLGGVAMRLVRIKGDRVKPGALLDGVTLLEANYSAQIDNMEGLDVVDLGNGDVRLILVSDDNHSFLQRNIMLEFRLMP
ncbi:hypothetical protein E6C51_09890 [Allorhizobium terrae]|uniref:Phytase-like domain-containing protein n=1 Tax=Allorhizobium terrae TaxID=1848972 RepID=A0A4V3W867_9HYPH|nr:hypothetical protein E6C51_09890 [Allorhizobium terrae]